MVQKIKALIKRLIRGKYYSLNYLDKKIEKYVNYNDGYFVELGANDGINQSNTLYFEKYRKWRGLLVEPVPQNYLKCIKNRSSSNKIYCTACVSFGYGKEFVRIAYSNPMSAPMGLESDVGDPLAHAKLGESFLGNDDSIFEFGAVARTLNSLLIQANSPHVIDLLSLDVEGAEIEVLKGIVHQAFRFKYIPVECREFSKLNAYMVENNYRFIEKLSEQDYLFSSESLQETALSAGR